MAGQSGAIVERLHTAWHAVHQPSWLSTIALQYHPTTDDTCIETLEKVRTYAISRWHHACTHDLPVAGQSGTLVERLRAARHALYQPWWLSAIALQHHPTTDDACNETLKKVRTCVIS